MKEKIQKLLSIKLIKIVIRVIGIASTLFTILMIILLCVGSCSNNLNSKDKEVNNAPKFTNKIYNVAQVDNVAGNNWRFYSLNDLTSYDILNNIWNYNISRGNPLLLNNGVARYGSEAYIHLVDGGANVHIDYTGFQVLYRVSQYFITYSEDNSRFNINFKFDFCGLNDNTPLFGMTFKLYRYKFSSTQGYADTEIVSYFTDSSSTAINVFTSHPFMLKVAQTPTGTNITDWWLYDVFGFGNYTSYQEAYDTGYGIGYNDGYNVGYNDGIQVDTSTMFDIVREGFISVTSLFNIQILPGLTLGTLLLTPVIIVIIIALFHLFKG